MFGLGPMEMLIVGIIAVLLFGKRLPEVGRSLGRGLVEFKKGVRDVQDDIDVSSTSSSGRSSHATYNEIDDRDEATAPKFDPPPAEPQAEKSEDESVSA